MTVPNTTEPQGNLVEGPDWLTQPTLDGLIADPSKIESLDPTQKKDFHTFMDKHVGGNTSPAPVPPVTSPAAPATPAAATPPATPAPGTQAPATPAPAAPEGGIVSPDDIPAPKAKDRQKFFEKHGQLAAELNTNKQLLANAKKANEALLAKVAELQKQPLTAANPDDIMDPNSLKNVLERLARSEETVKAMTDHIKATSGMMETEYQNRTDALQADETALSLERFQLETADGERLPEPLALKTTVPFADLKSEIEQFAVALGGLDRVNAYLTDPAYKARVEAAGYKLSEGFIKNLPVYNEIWAINKDVVEGKAPDHMTAYVARLVKGGKLREWQTAAKLEGANAVVTQVSSRSTQTPLLQPDQGPKPALGGWTKESALQFYRDNPDVKPGSPEAVKKAEISALIQSGQLR